MYSQNRFLAIITTSLWASLEAHAVEERARNFDFILFHWRLHFFQRREGRMHASKSTAVIIMTMTWHTFRLAQNSGILYAWCTDVDLLQSYTLCAMILDDYYDDFTTISMPFAGWYSSIFNSLSTRFCVANKGNMTRIFIFLPPPP